MRTRLALGTVIAACAAAIGLGAQQPAETPPPRPTGLIVGRVVDGVQNAPVTGVIVTLTGGGLRPRRVLVDGQGRFLFHELPAGAFTIVATKTGFLDGSYGMLRPDGAGRTLDLAAGERVTNAVVRLWRFATISGTVRDDAGDPVFARVQALRRMIVAGRWRFVNTGLGGNADDRGVYRITGLLPGDYALVVTSMTTTLPASLVQLANATRSATAADSSATLTELQTNGTASLANDVMQRSNVTIVGDALVLGSGIAPVRPNARWIEVYPTVWYPSAPTPVDATTVTVGPGDNRVGVDIRPTLTRLRRLSGTVVGPAGPVAHLALRLVPAMLDAASAEITSSLSLSLTTAYTSTDANGAFTFLAPPGQFIIRALTTPPPIRLPPPPAPPVALMDGLSNPFTRPPPSPTMVTTDPTLWTATPASVGDGDTTGVVVTLRAGLRVTGRVEFEGAAVKPAGADLRAIRVTMDPADGRSVAFPSAYQAQIDQDGRFYTIGLIAGRYLLRVDPAPRGWTIKSAIVDGQDLLDGALALEGSDVDGLVLTFTDRPSSLTGTVADREGRPDPTATVLVFPSNGQWTDLGTSPRRLRSIRTSRTGTFTIAPLPAGEYFVIAASDAVVQNWQDPAFLQRLSRVATRVTIADAQSQSVTLTTTSGIQR